MSTGSTTFPEKSLCSPADSFSLLERIAGGDHDAVSECITRYGDLIWFLARKFSTSSVDAEDAAQEIFLELWQKATCFDRTRSSEQTFIVMVARRRLIDRRRRMNSAIQTVAMDDNQGEPVEELLPDAMELHDEAAKAASCLEKLAPDQRTILTMSIHQGHSHNSISNRLKMPLGTVKSFARRGLLQLRDCMNRNTLLPAGNRSR